MSPDASVEMSPEVCDPVESPCAPLVRLDSDCSFPGTPPGGLPQLDVLEAGLTFTDDVVAATLTDTGPAFALADGRLVDSDGALIVELVDRALALTSVPDAVPRFVFSTRDGDDLVVIDATATDRQELLRVAFSSMTHGGGVAVDEDRLLFVGIGDDDSDELAAQDATTWYGSVLRVQLGEHGTGYTVPADNPFDGTNGAVEVFATGFRDPSSIVVGDPRVFVTDRGVQFDEVNSVISRGNFGWPYLDGTTCQTAGCAPQRYDGPLARHARTSDCTIVGGGQFPEDHEVEELRDVFLYAGTCDGQVHALRVAPNGRVVTDVLGVADGPVAGFAGPELLLSGRAGYDITLADGASSAMFPSDLSDSNCFDLSGSRPEPAPGLIPYFVRSPLWTDGATKRRYMVLPAGGSTTVDESGHLEFPTGSLLLKEFGFDFGDGVSRPVEMRVMRRNARTWSFFTYRFDDTASDATIVEGKDEAVFDVWLDDEPTTVDYLFPDPSSCRTCHSSSRLVLGPRTDQLAGMLDYGAARHDQLEELARIDVLAPIEVEPLPDPSDPDEPVAARARAYLDANCGHCHRPGGWVPPDLTLDLRYSTPAAEMKLCNERMQYPSPFVPGDFRVVPGSPEDSVLYQRTQVRGLGQMPLLATSVVDPVATDLLAEWIREMTCEVGP